MTTKKKSPRKPRRKKARSGEYVNHEKPVWEPLLGLARIYADEFMWMGEIELEHGLRLQSYKHFWTRRYLHLDPDGNPWVYRDDGRYEPWVYELLDLFNRVVMWKYPGGHREDCELDREYRRDSGQWDEPAETSLSVTDLDIPF
jgi:hypothetical protein